MGVADEVKLLRRQRDRLFRALRFGIRNARSAAELARHAGLAGVVIGHSDCAAREMEYVYRMTEAEMRKAGENPPKLETK